MDILESLQLVLLTGCDISPQYSTNIRVGLTWRKKSVWQTEKTNQIFLGSKPITCKE